MAVVIILVGDVSSGIIGDLSEGLGGNSCGVDQRRPGGVDPREGAVGQGAVGGGHRLLSVHPAAALQPVGAGVQLRGADEGRAVDGGSEGHHCGEGGGEEGEEDGDLQRGRVNYLRFSWLARNILLTQPSSVLRWSISQQRIFSVCLDLRFGLPLSLSRGSSLSYRVVCQVSLGLSILLLSAGLYCKACFGSRLSGILRTFLNLLYQLIPVLFSNGLLPQPLHQFLFTNHIITSYLHIFFSDSRFNLCQSFSDLPAL